MKIRTYDLSGRIGSGNPGPVFLNGTVQLELSSPHVFRLLPRLPQSPPFPIVPPSRVWVSVAPASLQGCFCYSRETFLRIQVPIKRGIKRQAGSSEFPMPGPPCVTGRGLQGLGFASPGLKAHPARAQGTPASRGPSSMKMSQITKHISNQFIFF